MRIVSRHGRWCRRAWRQIRAAVSFVQGWLERDGDLAVSAVEHSGLPA